jgi:hypothetical protein
MIFEHSQVTDGVLQELHIVAFHEVRAVEGSAI